MKFNLKLLVTIPVLLFLPKIFLAQKEINCKIIDIESTKPIPYANIWIKNTNIGVTSNHKGDFSLKIDNLHLNDSIIISSIGFNDTLIKISRIQSTINLKPKTYQIPEITAFPRQITEYVLNDLSETKFKGGIMNDTTPLIAGRYFPHNNKIIDQSYIKSVIIYSRDSHKGKLSLRLYSFDTLNIKPIKELINKRIIVKTKKSIFFKAKPIEVDLSEYRIVFPKEGVLIGVEWLIIPENRYSVTFSKINGKKKEKRTMYSPSLCATIDKKNFKYSYRGGFWNGKIISKNRPEHYFNPAISLKLIH
ncbi:MAG: carboxypeptidase-like regulatory domain-containing protein [Bacteroidales bacterium]|nr:carboxypeptidase-like regulatory domain-containing protein [Bacteroidales bacterium]